MTPKSLLRLPAASCSLAELTNGSFRTVIEDRLPSAESDAHIVFLTGKLFYEVADAFKKTEIKNVKIVRIEQLYPFPQFELKKLLKDCQPQSFTWIQEEPQNMGAWNYIEPYLRGKLNADTLYIGRPASASTAAGSNKRHIKEQQKILEELVVRVRSK